MNPYLEVSGKKIAKEKGKAQEEDMGLKDPVVGNKRRDCMENLSKVEGRVQKKVCRVESCNNNSDFLDKTVMSAKQHRQEK